MGFIGPAEAVPLLQNSLAWAKNEFLGAPFAQDDRSFYVLDFRVMTPGPVPLLPASSRLEIARSSSQHRSPDRWVGGLLA